MTDTEKMVDFLDAAAERSAGYRNTCAASVKAGRANLLPVEIGHGTYLMCAMAAENCGSESMLLVVPAPSMMAAAEQLRTAGYSVSAVDNGKGAMAGACRQAADRKPRTPSSILIASHRQMAEAGHWHEAWRDKRPFDFVAVVNAEECVNLMSERNRGLETVARRAGTVLLLCDRDRVEPPRMHRVASAWNAVLCRPGVPTASNACEAASMDVD